MSEQQETKERIKVYYKRAKSYIKNNDVRSATNILYNEMPIDLYDQSIDILYNRNKEFSDKKLLKLIDYVDSHLVKNANDIEIINDDTYYQDKEEW